MTGKASEDKELAIIRTDRGYEPLNERCEVLDAEKAKQVASDALANGESSVSLLDTGCYYDMELTPEMQDTPISGSWWRIFRTAALSIKWEKTWYR